ncbi:hypothetical protein FRC08_013997 [Ceratobasidium sp. 394]|nr:hypothetical protein FRC08_013997 [Ceratobasidium sp. 394]
MQERLRKAEEHKPGDFARKAEQAATSRPGYADCIPHGRLGQTGDSEPTETRVPKIYTPTRVRTPSPRSQLPVAHGSPSSIDHPTLLVTHPTGHEAASSILKAVTPEPAPKPRPTPTAHSAPRPPAGRQRDSGSGSTLHPERPKSAAPSPGLAVPPHVNTSTSPSDANHEQERSPMNVKTPRASGFHPERTPRAPACPVPEPSSQPDMKRAQSGESTRRVDVAMGATVAAAAAAAYDRAGGKKRSKEAELQAQEERRVVEELLAKERRRQEDGRRARERAKEARLREAAEKRDREERARIERERRGRQEQEERKRRWAEPQYEHARPPLRSEFSLIDAWNSYELCWSALGVASPPSPLPFVTSLGRSCTLRRDPSRLPRKRSAHSCSLLCTPKTSRKMRLRNAMLRWHSGQFRGLLDGPH